MPAAIYILMLEGKTH